MAKLPSFQFYPGDWMKDPDLRRCSLFARGLLADLLCLCHESARRGVLCDHRGEPWTNLEIRQAVGALDEDQFLEALNELESKNVLSRDDKGCLLSRRMVRDEERRQTYKQNGSKGGSKKVANALAKDVAKPSPSSSSSSSTSVNKEEINKEEVCQAIIQSGKRKGETCGSPAKGEVAGEPRCGTHGATEDYSAGFDAFWNAYPRQEGKVDAWKAWPKALDLAAKSSKRASDESVDEFLARRARDFAVFVADKDRAYVRLPATWLNGGNWDDNTGSRVATDEDLANWTP
jgi:hypothetical protein